jgi:hypothetical protein
VGGGLGLSAAMAALGVVEVVDEAMANAARVHAIESGKGYDGRAVIAFGGGGPVHACRVAEKLGVRRILVPSGAGVGSAIGFLRAPVAYEVVRSLYQRFATFDRAAVNALLAEMAAEAREAVARGAFGAPVEERRLAYMRYVGQGHEIAVPLPARDMEGGGRGGGARPLRRGVRPLLRPPGAGQRRGGDELRRHGLDAGGGGGAGGGGAGRAGALPAAPPSGARHGHRRGGGVARVRPRGDGTGRGGGGAVHRGGGRDQHARGSGLAVPSGQSGLS